MMIAGHMPHLRPTPRPTGGPIPDRRIRIATKPKTGDRTHTRSYSRTDANYLYAHR